MNNRYLAVIFDKDGVIADSEYCNVMTKHRMLQDNGIFVDWHYHDRFVGATHQDMWAAMKEEFGDRLPESVEYYVHQWSDRRAEMVRTEGMRAMPGAVECVHMLKDAGVPVALASSSNLKDIHADLAALGLTDGFDTVVSGEQCAHGKPDPEIFLTAALHLGIAPERCVVFEDAHLGVAAAKAAGMKCFAYRSPNAAPQDLSAADVIFSDFTALTVEQILAAEAGRNKAFAGVFMSARL